MKATDLIPDFYWHKDEIYQLINSIDDDYKEMDFDTFPEDEEERLDYLATKHPDTYDKLQSLKKYFCCECTYNIDNLTCGETYIRRIDAIGRAERPRGKIVATLSMIRVEIILGDK